MNKTNKSKVMSSLEKFKCGYCKWIVWRDKNGLITHGCFGNSTELIIDNNRNLFKSGKHVENENSIADTEEYIYDKENIEECIDSGEAVDTDKLDEDLISAVKERPALYDFRISVKIEAGNKRIAYGKK